jgi:hypothetical protein
MSPERTPKQFEALVADEAQKRHLSSEQVLEEVFVSYFRDKLSQEERDRLAFYRNEVIHEFNLLSQRLIWYVTCQSLLITSIALVMTTREWDHRKAFAFILIGLGIVISILTFVSVERAVEVLNEWHYKKEIELLGGIDLSNVSPSQKKWLPYVIKRKRRRGPSGQLLQDQTHLQSLWISRWLAPLFSFALLLIGLFVCLG